MNDDRLLFTDHATVRLIERHVDDALVDRLRGFGLDDHAIAPILRAAYGSQLADLVGKATRAYAHREAQRRAALGGLRYILHLGHVPFLIAGRACVTVLPAR